MTELRFVGTLYFMNRQWPVDVTIPLGPLDPYPAADSDPNPALGKNPANQAAAPGPNSLPIEIRPHPGLQITAEQVAAAATDKEKDALLAARFPWLADCFDVAAAVADQVAADLSRLAKVSPEKLLKPDGSINKSAVARELGYSTGGSTWPHVGKVVQRLRSKLQREAA